MRWPADDSDIKVTPAQRAYLLAFDNWLKRVWASDETGTTTDGASALKDACLADVLP